MATSQNFSTGNQYVVFYMVATQTSQDISNNTSNVTCDFYLKRTNTGYTTTGTFDCNMTINGTAYTKNWYGSFNENAVKVYSQSVTVGHNSDGTKTLNMSASLSGYYSGSGGSWSMTLSTIPRTSGISISSNNVNAGTNINVTISSASSGFTHNYHLVFGDGVYTLGSSVAGGTYTVTIPMACLNKIPSATSGYGTIYCDTYNGSTKLGTTGVGITVNVPSSVVPTLTSLGTSGNNLQWSKYVQSFSTCTLTVNGATGAYGSTIASYRITGQNIDCYDSQGTTSTLSSYGTFTYTATITDSRGRTASKTASITVIQYYEPSFTAVNAYRSNSSGTADATSGTYIYVSATWSFASVTTSNSATCYASVRELPSGTFGTESQITTSGGNKIFGTAYVLTKEYEVKIRVTDGLNKTAYSYIKVPTASCIIGYRAGGLGVSIGKNPTKDGFEVDWTSYFNKNINFYTNDTGINWACNGDSANITFHGDDTNGSYLRYDLRDDLNECHSFGGTHWSTGWKEWARIDTDGIAIFGTGSNKQLLRLETERPWYFRQGNTGASSSLDLVSSAEGKSFKVLSPNGNGMSFYVSDTASQNVISIVGNTVWHGGNCTVWTGTNQNCYRFDNGVQIIRQWKSLGTINITYQWGNLFTQGGAQGNLDNYGWAFKAAPQVVKSVQADGSLFVIYGGGATTTHPGSYELARGSTVSGLTNVIVHCISVGEWK